MKQSKIVYIAHPVGGNVKENLQKVAKITRKILIDKHPDLNIIPVAPYFLYCHSLDDDIMDERLIGMQSSFDFLSNAKVDELWLYGEKISNGMISEIELADKSNIIVVAKTIGTHNALKELRNPTKKESEYTERIFSLEDEEFRLIENALEYVYGRKMEMLVKNRSIMNDHNIQQTIKKANEYDELRTKIHERNDIR